MHLYNRINHNHYFAFIRLFVNVLIVGYDVANIRLNQFFCSSCDKGEGNNILIMVILCNIQFIITIICKNKNVETVSNS